MAYWASLYFSFMDRPPQFFSAFLQPPSGAPFHNQAGDLVQGMADAIISNFFCFQRELYFNLSHLLILNLPPAKATANRCSFKNPSSINRDIPAPLHFMQSEIIQLSRTSCCERSW